MSDNVKLENFLSPQTFKIKAWIDQHYFSVLSRVLPSSKYCLLLCVHSAETSPVANSNEFEKVVKFVNFCKF